MAINNPELQFNAAALDATVGPGSDNLGADNLADIFSRPDNLIAASVADAGTAVYNLADKVTGDSLPDLKTEDVLGFFADLGYSDPAEYYAKHPLASQIGSLLVGGMGAAKLANGAMSVSMKAGKVMFNSSAAEVSMMARVEAAAAEKLATDGIAGKAFKASLSKFNAVGAGSIITEAAIQETVFAGLMSQHTMLEDYDWEDWLWGAGIYGGVSFLTKGLSARLERTKGLTGEHARTENKIIMDNLGTVPQNALGTPTEAAYLQRNIVALEKAASEEGLSPALADSYSKVARSQRDDQFKAIDSAKADDLKVYDIEKSQRGDLAGRLHEALTKKVELDPSSVVGVQSIRPLKAAEKFDGVAPSQKIKTFDPVGDYDNVAMGLRMGKKKEDIANALGMSKADVTKIEDSLTTQMFDVKSGRFYDMDEAVKVMGLGDSKLNKFKVIKAGVRVHDPKLSSVQVQVNLSHAAKIGNKASKMHLNDVELQALGTGNLKALSSERRQEVIGYLSKQTKKEKNINFDPDKFWAVHKEATVVEIKSMMESGLYQSDEVAARLGLDEKVIEDVVMKGKVDEVGKLVADWKEVAGPRFVAMKGSLNNKDEMQKVINMDDHESHIAQEQFTRVAVAESHVQLLQDLNDMAKSGVGSIVQSRLPEVNQALFSSRFFGSSDFSMRHLPTELKDAVLYLGDKSARMITKAGDDIAKKLILGMKPITSNPIALGNFNKSMVAIRNAKAGQGEVLGILDDGVTFARVNRKTGEVVEELATFDRHSGAFWNDYLEYSTKQLALKNFNRKMLGQDEIVSKGLVLPATNLREGFRAYIPGAGEGGNTILVHSPTEEGLAELINQARIKHPEFANKIITPGTDAKRFNRLEGHAQLGFMKYSEFGKGKTGTEYSSIAKGTEQMEEFLADFRSEHARHSALAWRNINAESNRVLGTMHDVHFGQEGAKVNNSVWNTISKTAFGGNELYDNNAWNNLNSSVGDLVQTAVEKVSGVMHSVKGGAQEFEVMQKAYEDAGVLKEMPWKSANDMLQQTKAYTSAPKYATKAVAFNNSVTATLALRFLDTAHAMINTLSIPITTMPEIGAAMKASGSGKFSTMKLMMEGTRRSALLWDEVSKAKVKRWTEAGIIQPHVSELTDSLHAVSINPSLMTRAMETKAFKATTYLSDHAEILARHVAAFTGDAAYDVIVKANKAKDIPALRDAFVTTFVKRSMGNYNPRQRPVMFQGNIGSALGLFQTYMWTLGQNTYRFLEAGDRANAMRLLGAQTSMFGLQSLPAYEYINHYIGAHYGNSFNTDITTTIYDNFGQKDMPTFGDEATSVAEISMYGLPGAMLQSALYTRGTLAPRSPLGVSGEGGIGFNPAAFAPIKTGFDMMGQVYNSMQEGMGLGDSFTSAFQQQQLSRPLSRFGDFVQGNSVDRTGAVVDPSVGISMDLAMAARVTGARPLQEQVIRNLGWNNSFYNSQNSKDRKETTKALRDAMQDGELNEERYLEIFTRYMERKGTVSGWKRAMNDAHKNVETGKVVEVPRHSALEVIQRMYMY